MEIITRYSALKSRACETRDYLSELQQSYSLETNFSEFNLLDRVTTALNGCANFMVFHDYYTIGEVRLTKFNTCKKHLLCPFCASRRAGKNVKVHEEKIETLMTGRKELIPVMITLTVKNQPDLKRVYNHMKKSFKTLMDRRRRNKHESSRYETEMKKVQGAVAAHELTFNQDTNEWHPHIHMIALLDGYIDVKKLSKEWHDITGDSYIVDIRKISAKKSTKEGISDLSAGLVEVFKYALKFSDLPQEKLWEAYKFLRGKRMTASYGDLHGIKVPESLLDDPIKELPYIEMFYVYSSKHESYDLRTMKKCISINDQVRNIENPKSREYEMVTPDGEIKSQLISKKKMIYKFTNQKRSVGCELGSFSSVIEMRNILCTPLYNNLCTSPGRVLNI